MEQQCSWPPAEGFISQQYVVESTTAWCRCWSHSVNSHRPKSASTVWFSFVLSITPNSRTKTSLNNQLEANIKSHVLKSLKQKFENIHWHSFGHCPLQFKSDLNKTKIKYKMEMQKMQRSDTFYEWIVLPFRCCAPINKLPLIASLPRFKPFLAVWPFFSLL